MWPWNKLLPSGTASHVRREGERNPWATGEVFTGELWSTSWLHLSFLHYSHLLNHARSTHAEKVISTSYRESESGKARLSVFAYVLMLHVLYVCICTIYRTAYAIVIKCSSTLFPQAVESIRIRGYVKKPVWIYVLLSHFNMYVLYRGSTSYLLTCSLILYLQSCVPVLPIFISLIFLCFLFPTSYSSF